MSKKAPPDPKVPFLLIIRTSTFTLSHSSRFHQLISVYLFEISLTLSLKILFGSGVSSLLMGTKAQFSCPANHSKFSKGFLMYLSKTQTPSFAVSTKFKL